MIKKYRVFVPGAWDLFHAGHVRLLQKARKIASMIIVGIDTDNSIEKRKGKPPIIAFKNRQIVLKACSGVDKIVNNKSGSLDVNQLNTLNIEVVILADCWLNKNLVGKKEVEEAGIKIQYFPYTKGISSTKIKKKIKEENK